jgi:cell division protein FtsQ
VVTLVPRVGDQTIYMGSLEKYEKKLRRMRIFYEKALVKVGWNKYSRFNLEYDNQVVCTKREKR